MDLSVIV